MNIKLTVAERLKDLRVEKGWTLDKLAEETGLSKSALGLYETDDKRDISPFAILKLAETYEVTTDYLLGASENKKHSNTELIALHLSDDALTVLKDGKFNHRLLSELICHKQFRRLMVDAEIYVDRIADSRISDLNAMLEVTRKQVQEQYAPDGDDLYIRTLELAQVQTGDYFKAVVSKDLTAILNDIRSAHVKDESTADEETAAADVARQLQSATNYEGSKEERQLRAYLAAFGIDYDSCTKEELVTIISVLKKSKHLKNPMQRQRGKASSKHRKGKK